MYYWIYLAPVRQYCNYITCPKPFTQYIADDVSFKLVFYPNIYSATLQDDPQKEKEPEPEPSPAEPPPENLPVLEPGDQLLITNPPPHDKHESPEVQKRNVLNKITDRGKDIISILYPPYEEERYEQKFDDSERKKAEKYALSNDQILLTDALGKIWWYSFMRKVFYVQKKFGSFTQIEINHKCSMQFFLEAFLWVVHNVGPKYQILTWQIHVIDSS